MIADFCFRSLLLPPSSVWLLVMGLLLMAIGGYGIARKLWGYIVAWFDEESPRIVPEAWVSLVEYYRKRETA